MKRILLIVDPQYDFISGSLAVNDAERKMNNLCEYIKESSEEYAYVFMTADGHPKNHSSFVKNGGLWSEHCVYGTHGAKIYEPLMKVVVDNFKDKFSIAYKGLDADKEQYSVFALDKEKNITNSGGLVLFNHLYELLKDEDIAGVDVCGIAGDFCVLNTVKDLAQLIQKNNILVLEPFSPSIDGGEKLSDFCYYNQIESISYFNK